MALYERVVDGEGKESYKEIEAPAPEPRDLTDDELRADPRFEKEVQRNVRGRERFRSLKTGVETLGLVVDDEGNLGKGDPKDPPDDQKPETPPANLDPDALYANFKERLASEAQAEAKQSAEAEVEVTTLTEKHGLVGDDDAIAMIRASTTRAHTAEALGRRRLRFDTINAQAADAIPKTKDLVAGLKKRLGQKDD